MLKQYSMIVQETLSIVALLQRAQKYTTVATHYHEVITAILIKKKQMSDWLT